MRNQSLSEVMFPMLSKLGDEIQIASLARYQPVSKLVFKLHQSHLHMVVEIVNNML